MSIRNPHQLVAEYKKTGEFDRLRRELFAQFQASEGVDAFMTRVEDVVEKRLETDLKLQYMAPDNVHRELLKELDRYPIVERALADMPAFADPEFGASIRRSARAILLEDRGPPKQDDDDAEDDDVDMDVDDDETSSDEESPEPSEAAQTPNPHSLAEADGPAISSSTPALTMDEVVPLQMVNGDSSELIHGADVSLNNDLTPMDSAP